MDWKGKRKKKFPFKWYFQIAFRSGDEIVFFYNSKKTKQMLYSPSITFIAVDFFQFLCSFARIQNTFANECGIYNFPSFPFMHVSFYSFRLLMSGVLLLVRCLLFFFFFPLHFACKYYKIWTAKYQTTKFYIYLKKKTGENKNHRHRQIYNHESLSLILCRFNAINLQHFT